MEAVYLLRGTKASVTLNQRKQLASHLLNLTVWTSLTIWDKNWIIHSVAVKKCQKKATMTNSLTCLRLKLQICKENLLRKWKRTENLLRKWNQRLIRKTLALVTMFQLLPIKSHSSVNMPQSRRNEDIEPSETIMTYRKRPQLRFLLHSSSFLLVLLVLWTPKSRQQKYRDSKLSEIW